MTRLALVGLVVALGVGACGADEPELDAANDVTTAEDETPPTTALADMPAPSSVGDALDVDLIGESRVPAGPHTWVVEVTNTSADPIVVTFPTSQPGDVVLTRADEAVHRWSTGRFFQQEIRQITLDPQASDRVEIPDDLSAVEPGYYDLTISVAVVGPPEALVRSIRVVSPDA